MKKALKQSIQLRLWTRETEAEVASKLLNLALAEDIKTYHASFAQYKQTPLVSLTGLSKKIDVAHIWVKDESHRFGLNAFKVLGGSYAVARVIAKQLKLPVNQISYETITSEETKKALGEITFVTATDGNHGRGIAWTAEALGQKSVVYMPKGSSEERLQNIKNHGAEASITDMNYDDAVRMADQMAKDNNWILVQDTAWQGYEEIPTWVMQGYMTMALEAYQEILSNGQEPPTHIFLQAGVGSMAAAVSGFFRNVIHNNDLKIIIVEPDQADCLYKTASANDGTCHSVTDDMNTIMAGLACGEPSTIGWEVLKSSVDAFISCPDWTAAQGMRILGNPLDTDQKVVSGESGAVGIGVLTELMSESHYQNMREALHLNQESRILFFSTEGDTDKQAYRSIVWDGLYAKPSERI
jgi:diaminopropionate ammonia-lyase